LIEIAHHIQQISC